jgi:Formyl transferase
MRECDPFPAGHSIKELTAMSPSHDSDVRIVVITSPTSPTNRAFAERILAALALERVAVRALLIIEPLPWRSSGRERLGRLLRNPSPRRLVAGFLSRALRAVESAPEVAEPDPWLGMAEEVRRVGPLNGPVMLEALRSMEPDYLVLAGLGILNDDALAIPRRGTFNVHPGLLPWVRGVAVIERAVERRIPVGITAHYVNAGIDTGPIIRRELIPVQPYDTLASLERKSYLRCTQVMAELVAAAARGQHPAATPQGQRYPYCKDMSVEDYARVDEAVRKGLAMGLYQEWLAFHGSHVLPMDMHRSPPVGVKPLAARAGCPSSPQNGYPARPGLSRFL